MIGQNPYASVHYEATGIPFEVEPGYKRIPPTIETICAELRRTYETDISMPDFSYWVKQGVLLLNSTLTIGFSPIKDHTNINDIHFSLWSFFIRSLIEHICQTKNFVIFVLMGKRAEVFTSNITKDKQKFITLITPFPLGTRNSKESFVNCDIFRKCNQVLSEKGHKEIDWIGHTK